MTASGKKFSELPSANTILDSDKLVFLKDPDSLTPSLRTIAVEDLNINANGGGFVVPPTIITVEDSPVTAVDGLTYWVDTDGGEISILLPTSGLITIVDRYNTWAANNVIVSRVGGTVDGYDQWIGTEPMEVTFADTDTDTWQTLKYTDLFPYAS